MMKGKKMGKKNKDDITEAIRGLDIFTKNYCMNCAETKKQGKFVFNCDYCEFVVEDVICLIKVFANNHKHDYSMRDFGPMI